MKTRFLINIEIDCEGNIPPDDILRLNYHFHSEFKKAVLACENRVLNIQGKVPRWDIEMKRKIES